MPPGPDAEITETDLARQPHPFEYTPALAGTHHGGGGRPVNGQWNKGPQS